MSVSERAEPNREGTIARVSRSRAPATVPLHGAVTPRHVRELQRTIGNRAVGQLLGARPPWGDVGHTGHAVLQRLKKGDFADLDTFGFDVGTWIEFADAVKKVDHYGLTLALRLLDRRDGTRLDTIRAQLLIERQRHRLRKPPRSRMLDLFEPTTSRSESVGEELSSVETLVSEQSTAQSVVKESATELLVEEEPKAPSIRIGDGVAETTDIRSASDLLVWLVSHPTGQAKTPKDFASSDTLRRVLGVLEARERLIDPPEVWDVVRDVVGIGSIKPLNLAERAWPMGEWGKKDKKELGSLEWDDVEVPLEFRRLISKEEYELRVKALRRRLAKHTLVGLHATTAENLGPLMAEGVSDRRVNSGHGVGKGRGFYIIPVATIKGVPRAEKSAKGWDPFVVAVYLPRECEARTAGKLDNVQTLEKEKQEGESYYYTFGDDEAVIPPSLFDQIVLVRDPADLTTADPGLPSLVVTTSAMGFLAKLL